MPNDLDGLLASRRSVLKHLSIATLSLAASGAPSLSFAAPAERSRWSTQPYRIVQTNLREIDARESPAEIARAVKDFGATALISNVGGIVAFYPTALPLQYRTPYLRGDFVGEMIEASRSQGLAYIGRYDLSKSMKPAFDAHPDWFVKNRDGSPREYAGSYQACPNGGWAQEYALEIMREGLTRYDVDGLFFNMTGYPTTDYSNVDHGICVCDNCRRRFRAMYDRELPQTDGFQDPNWVPYLDFQRRTSAELAEKIRTLSHSLRPNVPLIDFFGRDGVSRGETQRRVDRPAPEWPYQVGEQTRAILATRPGPTPSVSVASAAHIDYPWRQATESAACELLRLSQALAVGAKLDLYLMGTLADQNDQSWLAPVSKLYKWHAANEQHYAGLAPSVRVALYLSQTTMGLGGMTPWARYLNGAGRGAYTALVDARLPFWMVNGSAVAKSGDAERLLQGYDVIILPHILMLSDAEAAALDGWVQRGGLLIATGMTGGYDEMGRARSAMPLASSPVASFGTPVDAHGWSLEDAGADLDYGAARIPLDGHYFTVKARPGARNLIGFAPDQRFGPPELSYAVPGVPPRSDPGVLAMAFGRGHAVHVPWLPDWQYYRDGLEGHRRLFSALVERYAPPQPFVLEGDGAVEFTVQRQSESRRTLVHVVNFAGQRDGRYTRPPALHGLRLGVRGAVAPRAQALVAGRALVGRREGERLWFDLPPVAAFEAVQLADAS